MPLFRVDVEQHKRQNIIAIGYSDVLSKTYYIERATMEKAVRLALTAFKNNGKGPSHIYSPAKVTEAEMKSDGVLR